MESYYLYFLTYSFLGWCMETTLFSVKEKRFVNRGFLNGPLCPVYGFGMVIIIYCLEPFYDNIPLLFLFGMILASILEYITGFLLEKLFYTRWWDYSKKRFNINGYVCLENSLAWGFLCIIMIHIIQPRVESFINDFTNVYLHSFVVVTLIALIVDVTFTILHLVNFKTLVKNVEEVKQTVETKFSDSTILNESRNKLKEGKISISKYIDEIGNNHNEVFTSPKVKSRIENRLAEGSSQMSRLLRNYNSGSPKSKYHETTKQIQKNFSKNEK